MRIHIKNPAKTAKLATIVTLLVMVGWGVMSVVLECRPFWIDEWRIIYNLKFKTLAGLWGSLDYMQQFPRVYLSGLKVFTSALDYSYLSLRLPSFLIAVVTMWAVYRLVNRLYPQANYNRFLMALMLVSCGTFTEYFVQIKQYTMDLFLCVAVLWQMIYLLQAGEREGLRSAGYLLLCLGFLAAPFFSYTYPVAVAPVYVVVLVSNVQSWQRNSTAPDKIKRIVRQWVPLFICTFSITAFYITDVAQLTSDKDMRAFWGHIMMDKGFDWQAFLVNIFHMLAQAGSGFLFWWLFGILCTAALIYGIYTAARNIYCRKGGIESSLVLYSVTLLLLMIVLYAAGKLPLGEPRLNAFAIPALAVLLIHLLERMNAKRNWQAVSGVLSFVLMAGLAGNVLLTIYASFADPKYARRMAIYRATERAVAGAQSKNIPILVTPGVAYPYEETQNLPYTTTVPGDWVLMTFPAYHASMNVPVYAIDDTARLGVYLGQLPDGVTSVMVGDGIAYRVAKVTN